MYTVENIEEDIVILENRDTRQCIDVNINQFNSKVKVNDIVKYDKYLDEYILLKDETNYIKSSIRERFNKLRK